MKKLDIHIHTSIKETKPSEGIKTSSAEKMLDYLQGKEIEQGIIMSMGESMPSNNDECIEICSRYPKFFWNCNFDAEAPETIFDRMALYKEMGAVGVGELCINERMDSPIISAIFSAAEKMELPVLFHMSPRVGYAYGIVDDAGLPLLEETLRKYPHLKLVGHSQAFWIEISADAPTDDNGRYGRGMGEVKTGGRLVELFRCYPNLYGDLSAGSGFTAITRDEKFGLAFLEEFSDRLMFGTDTVDVESKWQVPLGQWLEEKCSEGKLKLETMEKICYSNAMKIYGLDIEDKETVEIKTGCGRIRGIRRENQHAFLGIRYAVAKRFSYPEPVDSWEGVYDATSFGPACYQMRAFQSEALSEDPFYYKEFRENLHFRYSDDCLNLNIWTPAKASAEPLPVIVFIHGGAFLGGSSAEKHLMHPQWTEHGAVAVTLNYRLGPFGFLCTSEGKEESGHTGNYGLYDQLAALKWIKAHIADFGGDSENITLMGQSAGGMCVLRLCTSPETKGLFHKAVILSGGGYSETFCGGVTAEKNIPFGDELIRRTGSESLEEFRKLEASKILNAFFKELEMEKRGLEPCGPVIDGKLVRWNLHESIQEHQEHSIPYILCCTSRDLWMPELLEAVRGWAEAEKQAGNDDCYIAYFSRNLPGDSSGAFHSSDLWYWFGSLDRSWRQFQDKDAVLSKEMQSFLVSFARTGCPRTEKLGQWKSYAQCPEMFMEFGDSDTKQRKVVWKK